MTKACLPSPIGAILIDDDGRWLRAIRILDGTQAVPPGYGDPATGSLAAEATRQLRAYFGDSACGFNLPLAPAASVRGEALRAAIAAIPAGETRSYGAARPDRWFGSARDRPGLRAQPLPDHHSLPSRGRQRRRDRPLFRGQGVATKTWLLDHERRGVLI